MKVSTRLTLSMVTVALVSVATVGILTHQQLKHAMLPGEVERLNAMTADVARDVQGFVDQAQRDLLAARASDAVQTFAQDFDPSSPAADGPSPPAWFRSLAADWLAQLAAKPHYLQWRLVPAVAEAPELVRVDRDGAAGAARVVPPRALRPAEEAAYLRRSHSQPEGRVVVSEVEPPADEGLDPRPRLHLATTVVSPERQRLAAIVLSIDMTPVFDRINQPPYAGGTYTLLDEDGTIVSGSARPASSPAVQWTERFPGQTGMPAPTGADGLELRDQDGRALIAAVHPVQLADGSRYTLVAAVPQAELTRAAGAVGRATLIGALIGAFLALLLALLLARSLRRPIEQMTKAVNTFGSPSPAAPPVGAGGEFGTMARAFARMSAEVREKNASLAREAEKRRRAEKSMELLVSANPDAVVVVDQEKAVQFVNEAAVVLFGRSREEMLGGPWDIPLEPEGRQDVEIPNPAGPRWAAARTVAFKWLDQPAHLVRLRDVTQQREMEKQLQQAQKMEAIGQLAGGVAHDFNNLLTSINLSADMLLMDETLEPQEARDLLAEIHRSGERAAGLTRQLLVFSRRSVSNPVPLSLNAIVAGLEKMLRRLIVEDIELIADLAPDLQRVRADPTQMDQVIMNLTINARDAMPQGGRLTLATRNVTLAQELHGRHGHLPPGDYVALSIADTGIGMSEEVKSHLFEPFFTTKDAGRGTGLGLSTVYGIVQQCQGTIIVRSEPGRGSIFEILLPGINTTDTPESGADAGAGAPNGSETVLFVEDNDSIRRLSRLALEAFGYVVLEARNGREALELAARHAHPIQVVVTDIVMPELGGPPLVAALQEQRPDIKVIYISGYTDDAVVRYGVLESGIPFLQKPFSPTLLARKIREVLPAPAES